MSPQRKLYRRHRRSSGFTMLETIIIIVVIGILALITAPNFSSLLMSIKLDQTVAELQTELSGTQRSAIRGQKACVASLLVQNIEGVSVPSFQSGILNSCQMSGDHDLAQGVSIASNVIPNPNKASLVPTQAATPDTPSSWWEKVKEYSADWWCKTFNKCPPGGTESLGDDPKVVDVMYGAQGAVSYNVYSDRSVVDDMTGKFVLFVSDHPRGKQKCIAVSKRIGLTRIGNYRGGMSPAEITDEGICTSKRWDKQ